MIFTLCPACKGQKTLQGCGSITRIKCERCDGAGELEVVEDPIAELEKLKGDIDSKMAEIEVMKAEEAPKKAPVKKVAPKKPASKAKAKK